MVHNGIEYGMMAAYAEGLRILKRGQRRQAEHDGRRRDHAAARSRALPVRLQPARHRGGVAARQRDRLVAARPDGGCAGRGSRAVEVRRPGVRLRRGPLDHQGRDRRGRAGPVLTSALYERFSSRGEADFADKLLSAMRFEFGGHLEKRAGS